MFGVVACQGVNSRRHLFQSQNPSHQSCVQLLPVLCRHGLGLKPSQERLRDLRPCSGTSGMGALRLFNLSWSRSRLLTRPAGPRRLPRSAARLGALRGPADLRLGGGAAAAESRGPTSTPRAWRSSCSIRPPRGGWLVGSPTFWDCSPHTQTRPVWDCQDGLPI